MSQQPPISYLSVSPESQSQSQSPLHDQQPKLTLNRYIPQSPQPASPPETPSPSSPNKLVPALSTTTSVIGPATGVHSTNNNEPNMPSQPKGTPDGYSYASPGENGVAAPPPLIRHDSSSSVVAGMGINFPPDSNPLPVELSSPTREVSPLPSPSFQPHPVEKSSSHESGALSNGNGATSAVGGYGMAQSLSAGSSTGGYATQQPSLVASLHPSNTSQFTTPGRPRTVSPRVPVPNGANGIGSFASSSQFGYPSGEPRGRVISPNKMDGMGETSPPDYPPIGETASTLHNNNSITGSGDNPYDPPHLHGNPAWSANGYNGYGNFPLTGKESHLGSSPTVHPVRVPFKDSVGYWLGMYFFFNLGLTLFNKVVLVSFPFPYTLTGLHALSGCAGTYLALERGAFTPARLTQKENLTLAAFSVLYTINIAVSNISLQLVTVPFHQVVRASTPLFTILISSIFLRTRFNAIQLISLLPVVAGVGFATYGDYYFTAWGLILTLLGTFLAALKTVVTNLIQTGSGGRLKLHPLDLLMRMSPLAFIQCVICGWYTGELERVRRYGATQMTRSKAIALLINGVIACGLNIVSFTANKKAGALTMTVSANCKQVLTIALSVVLFNYNISPTNAIGILLTLIGGAWYGYVEYQEKKKKTKVLDRT
ncbi:hypothetical protein CI109_102064 [Kwoniella shandongensis]|uniref:Uncharacterized protein n=1 Tax=Kwoniella shandongensis TaxID=1734106 RepID=A0A5M6BQX3_9TREE|nr:uncharacterized protein CI109_006527 [Kwoniella shandongensis]KAA5525157.1 hypothetical protein CI109_006527 [Kwoniella shandongensis]